MKYLLDTNIISYCIKGEYPSIIERLKYINPENIYVPMIVKAELEYGARNSGKYDEMMKRNLMFFKAFNTVYFTEAAACAYGEIRYDLKKKGQLIGANDMLIAAIAKAENMILVTHNVKEFNRVDNLKVEDWTSFPTQTN